eukprot:COSAG01_NODE_3090_length_6601_cov_5.372347_6_plen_85_part_00
MVDTYNGSATSGTPIVNSSSRRIVLANARHAGVHISAVVGCAYLIVSQFFVQLGNIYGALRLLATFAQAYTALELCKNPNVILT